MKVNIQNFDVVISGGGLSGSLMALSLSKLRKQDGSLLSIAVIEAAEKKSASQLEKALSASELASGLFDQRVLALSHGSSEYLKKLGVWSQLSAHACPIKDIDISDRGNYGKARIKAKLHQVSALGYVIEMALIGNTLQSALKLHPNINTLFAEHIVSIDWSQEEEEQNTQEEQQDINKFISLTLSSGVKLNTSLLLGCDGVNSPSRKLANISVTKQDYSQVAIIANVATSIPHKNKAFERFTEQGPIAMLPLNSLKDEHRCSLVWTVNKANAKTICNLNDTDFKIALEQAFGYWLGGIKHVGERVDFPLTLLQAQQQTFHRMALIGNASHTIHPIAGQGFNLGLRDVKELAGLVEGALATNEDIGSFSLLHRYEKHRSEDQNEVIKLTDSLVTLFSNELPPLVAGRNIGLKVLNYLSPLKHKLVSKTMGY